MIMRSLSLDDLDEMLFEAEDSKSDQVNDSQSSAQSQRTPLSSNRRRAWLWKNPLHNSFDDTDIAIADRHPLPGIVASSSKDNSRRESLSSSQSSPNRSSPKRNRESKGKKEGGQGKSKKDSAKESSKDKMDSTQSSGNHEGTKPSVSQRLYRVLEEQALGEAVGKLSAGSTKNKHNNQPLNLCAPGDDVSPNNRYSY